MARRLRIVLPGQPHHVVKRGNNRCAVFRCDDDRRRYLDILLESTRKVCCLVHSYVLMPNHVHAIVTPEAADGLSRLNQDMGRRYVRYFNTLHQRTGTLWEGRYWSAAIDSAGYFFGCSRYVETNADRAGLAARPEDFAWSSARSNLLGITNDLVTPHELYLSLGTSPEARRKAYRDMFRTPVEDHALEVIRRATRGGTRVSSVAERVRLESEVRRARSGAAQLP